MSLHDLQHLRHNLILWKMNLHVSRRLLRKKNSTSFGEYTITVGDVSHLKAVERLHAQLFREPMLRWLLWVYRFRAPDLITVAIKGDQVVAYECFMFNEAELEQQIIHEVYIGVSDEEQGKGLATAMRKFSIESYNFGNLNGISTVARPNDIKALRSAQRSGFAILKQSLKPTGHYLFKALTKR